MGHRCLAEFLEELGHAGELVRVEAEVERRLEVAEITARVAHSGGSALLFGAVKGHDFPVLTNLLGTEERICRALAVASLGEAAARIAAALQPTGPEGWLERLRPAPAALGNLLPRRVRSGPCQQVVRLGRDVDLGQMPTLQAAPPEAGPAITAAAVFAADPQTRRQVAGRYDLQILQADRLAVCWADCDEPARLLSEYRHRQQQMPLAVVLGGDPSVLLAASAPLPPGCDTGAMAGLLRQKPLEVVACRTVELEVPAEAETVIEGFVDPGEMPAPAGPLCTPLGYCCRPRPVPVMHVTAVTHRANPVYPAMVFHALPNEACTIERALARVFLPLMKSAMPELVDYDLPVFGGGRLWAVVSIVKTYAGQARRIAAAAWAMRQFLFAKTLVVVDEQVDVRDLPQVLGAIAGNVDPSRDVFFHQGPPDPLDPAAPLERLGQRMGIDATRKLRGEGDQVASATVTMSDEIRRLVDDRWNEYGLGPAGK